MTDKIKRIRLEKFQELIEQGDVQIGDSYTLPGFMACQPSQIETVYNVGKDFVDTMTVFGKTDEDGCVVCEKRYYTFGTDFLETVTLGSKSYHNLLGLEKEVAGK